MKESTTHYIVGMSMLALVAMVFASDIRYRKFIKLSEEDALTISEERITDRVEWISAESGYIKEINKLRVENENLKIYAQQIAALTPVTGMLDPSELDSILTSLTDSSPFDSEFRITSRFGEGRGYQGTLRNGHLGNDMVPRGDWYVRPMWEGKVIDIGIDHWLGKYIVVEHSPLIRTRYAHLNTIFYTALPGEEVTTDTRVGIMGNTGNSDGAHLHVQLEVFNGEQWIPVDIYPWLEGHGGK